MENILSLSMAGIYSLLILNLTFLFLIGIRLFNLKDKVLELEETALRNIRSLKERIDLLEKALKLK